MFFFYLGALQLAYLGDDQNYKALIGVLKREGRIYWFSGIRVYKILSCNIHMIN